MSTDVKRVSHRAPFFFSSLTPCFLSTCQLTGDVFPDSTVLFNNEESAEWITGRQNKVQKSVGFLLTLLTGTWDIIMAIAGKLKQLKNNLYCSVL